LLDLLSAPGERVPVSGDGQENLRAVLEFYREVFRGLDRKG